MVTFVPKTWVAACGVLPLVALAGCGGTPENTVTGTVSNSTAPGGSVSPPAILPVPSTSAPATEPHALVLTATGTASVTSITYTLDGRPLQDGRVTLPWRTSLPVPADGRTHTWAMEVEYTGTANDNVDLVATYDGKVTARTLSSATGTGQVSASGGGRIGGSVDG